jgi:hypothetical protein
VFRKIKYPSFILTSTKEIKILRKQFKNQKIIDRLIIKALFGKKINKEFKRRHFKKIGI